LDVLDLYKPIVWEYSRLNITYNIMSKRKLKRLVLEKYVNGWDDPRLLTLQGLRRRGYTPAIIADLCQRVGVSRNRNTTDMGLLEELARQNFDPVARRAMVVTQPLKLTLINYPENKVEIVQADNFPGDKDRSRGTHPVPLSRVVYINRDDFRLEDSKDFYGLAPGKVVRLKYAFNIKCTGVKKTDDGQLLEAFCECLPEDKSLPPGKLVWVAEPKPGVSPLTVEVRLYDRLFKSEDPNVYKDEYVKDLNEKSLEIVKEAYADPSMGDVKIGDHYQFERIGFAFVDIETTPAHTVFNLTVKLKESKSSGSSDAKASSSSKPSSASSASASKTE